MKRSTHIISALVLTALALTACGKKSGGGATTPPPGPGAGGNEAPYQAVDALWNGYLELTDGKRPVKDLLKDASKCWGNTSCDFGRMGMTIRTYQDGRAYYVLQFSRNGFWAPQLYIRKDVQPTGIPNGFQMTGFVQAYDDFYSPNPGYPVGGGYQFCYLQASNSGGGSRGGIVISGGFNNGSSWGGGQITLGGNGGGSRTSYVTVCYEQPVYGMQAQGQMQQQQQFGSQTQDASGASPIWAGYPLTVKVEFIDGNKACLHVTISYRDQVIAVGELRGRPIYGY